MATSFSKPILFLSFRNFLSDRLRTHGQVFSLACLVVALLGYLFWGLALALGPLVSIYFAREAERKGIEVDFPFLLATTAVSAMIGVGVTQMFGLNAESIVQGEREVRAGTSAEGRVAEITGQTVPQLVTSFIPTNIFWNLTGGPGGNAQAPQTSVIAIVVFATLLGMAALGLRKKDPVTADRVAAGVDTLQITPRVASTTRESRLRSAWAVARREVQ